MSEQLHFLISHDDLTVDGELRTYYLLNRWHLLLCTVSSSEGAETTIVSTTGNTIALDYLASSNLTPFLDTGPSCCLISLQLFNSLPPYMIPKEKQGV